MNAPARDPLGWLDGELDTLSTSDLRRQRVAWTARRGVRLARGGRELVNFGSNDYLNLASDARLGQAVAQAIDTLGWGAAASPLVVGYSHLHERLEQRLAEFLRTEAALLFATGFAANAGTIPALVDREDAVFSDAQNHASIIDGCRLSRATMHVYPHADCATLATQLRGASNYRRRLIVTDSLFSMDGDLAPLADIAELADRYDAMLLVDEAHATGVFGATGQGVAELAGVAERVDVRIGTLSKALGSAGGFVAGRRSLTEWLVNRARSYVFSTAHPAAECAAGLVALDIVRDEPERRAQLIERAADMREQLAARGWNLGKSRSQIIPIIIGDPARTMELSATLAARGFFVPGIRPPSVPAGQSLLRLSLSAGHTPEMIDELLAALGRHRP